MWKSLVKLPLGRQSSWEDKIKRNVKEIGWEEVEDRTSSEWFCVAMLNTSSRPLYGLLIFTAISGEDPKL